MRAEIERLKTESTTRAQLITDYEKKIKDSEAKGRDTEALTARLTQLEKERDDAKAEARRARKEIDPEFRKQWQAPFDEATFTAEDMITRMEITDPETGAVRAGTKDDVDFLFKIESPTKRNAEIRKMFPEDAISVIPKIDRMVEINASFKRALAVEQAKAAELDKQEQGARLQSKQQWAATVEQLGKELAEKVEDYHDSPDDKEASELRQRGYAIFDSTPANPTEGAVKYASIRQMTAAHYPMKLKLTRLAAELEAAKAEIAQLKESDPSKSTRRSAGGAGAESGASGKSWEEEARSTLT